MGQILVRVEQLRRGVEGRTLLVVEGNFRERPDVTTRASAGRQKLRSVYSISTSVASPASENFLMSLRKLNVQSVHAIEVLAISKTTYKGFPFLPERYIHFEGVFYM